MPDEVDPQQIEEYGLSIPVEKLLLDSDNPRLYAQRKRGELESLQEEIYHDLMAKKHVPGLKRSIVELGLRENIFVQYRKNYDKYVVIEGNTRTAIHKSIIESGIDTDFNFNAIMTNVIKPSVSDAELSRMKVIWQLAKQDWGQYEKAALMREQYEDHGFPIADIARDFGTTKNEVNTQLEAIQTFETFQESTGVEDTAKFSYFSKEAPAKVRKWYSESESNMSDYFVFVSSGRIPSIALSGGLRDFGSFVENPTILQAFKEDETMTVEQGVQLLVQQDLLASFKWMKNLPRFTSDIYMLMDPKFQEMLKSDSEMQTNIKSLRNALNNLIELVDE